VSLSTKKRTFLEKVLYTLNRSDLILERGGVSLFLRFVINEVVNDTLEG
jgi:hypothetical protein